MKAVRFHSYGGPEVLRVEDVDLPQPGPGEIRIAVQAAGINVIDWRLRSGMMQHVMPLSFPAATGVDAAGVVDALGEGVTDVAVGDAVFGQGQGTMAEFAILQRWVAKPEALSFQEAAGYPIPVETAARILALVGLGPGQTLLIDGAAGAVGSAVIQFAHADGIRTIGTASGARQAYLLDLGATPTPYGPELADRVAALAPEGIDAAFDLSGSGIIPELTGMTGDPAKVVSIVDVSAAEHGAQTSFMAEDSRPALARAAAMAADGRFTLPIERTFTLDQVGEAHALSASGHAAGRSIVVPA